MQVRKGSPGQSARRRAHRARKPAPKPPAGQDDDEFGELDAEDSDIELDESDSSLEDLKKV